MTIPRQDIVLCDIVKAELYYGAYKGTRLESNLALYQEFFSELVSLPFDGNAAAVYGRIRARLEALGTPIGPNDLQIAAIALANDLILVTHNTREFSRVEGLHLEDWELSGEVFATVAAGDAIAPTLYLYDNESQFCPDFVIELRLRMTIWNLLLDTGVLVAFVNQRENFHPWALNQWRMINPPLLTCEAVITEACFLLHHVYGGEEAVMGLVSGGRFRFLFASVMK